MTDKELDDLFSKSFSEHRMPVPANMWERVNPQKEKKRRVIFWWWTGLGAAALLLLIGAMVWFSPGFSNKNAETATVLPVEKKKTTSGKESTTNRQSDAKPKQGGHLSEPASSGNNTVETVPSSVQPSEQKASKNYLSSDIERGKTKLKTINANVLHIILNKNKDDKNRNRKIEETENHRDEQVKEELTTIDSATTATEEIANSSLQKKDRADTAANVVAKKDLAASDTTSVLAKKTHKRKAASVELMIAGYESNRNVYDANKNVTPTFVTLGAVDPKAKTRLYSASINIRIEKPINKNLSFKTGLQFLQTRQRITYNEELVNQFAIINSLGLRNDTTRFAQINSQRPVIKSVYNSISIPLLISYHTNGSKVNLGASAGVLINAVSWYSGKVPDVDYKQTMAAKNTFRQNTGASLYLSLSAVKNWGNWQLFVEPNVQYTLSSITKSQASFNQKITSYGIGIGIKKKIGK